MGASCRATFVTEEGEIVRLPRSTIVALVLLALAAAPATARPGQGDAARAEHQRIVNYWTAERMASAKPRDLSLIHI